MDKLKTVVKLLHQIKQPDVLAGKKRFGILAENGLGITIPQLRSIAKKYKGDHELALHLWDTAIHEARLIATFIDKHTLVTALQMETWVQQFNSWDICDQCCSNLFCRTPLAYQKALEWSGSPSEYIKRAGFVMMATMAVHQKKAPDTIFLNFLEIIEKESSDARNFVKKAINWALRQIGKRNENLHSNAIYAAQQILAQSAPSSKWIAKDALRELKDPITLARIKKKQCA